MVVMDERELDYMMKIKDVQVAAEMVVKFNGLRQEKKQVEAAQLISVNAGANSIPVDKRVSRDAFVKIQSVMTEILDSKILAAGDELMRLGIDVVDGK